jgi:tetratricopeptide (TPR) repeat protein
LYLYTGRRGSGFGASKDPDEFYSRITMSKANYLLLTPLGPTASLTEGFADPARISRLAPTWAQEDSERYQPVYSNPREGTRIFQVQVDPNFKNAFGEYSQALKAIQLGNLNEADAGLRSSLKIDSKLSAAWTALGFVQLKRGETPEAHDSLIRAMEIDPSAEMARQLLRVIESKSKN